MFLSVRRTVELVVLVFFTREKGLCKGLRVIHSFEASQRLVNPDPSPDELAQWRSKPDREHPMVWRHQSGRRSLVIGVSASHIVGMSASRSRALLDELLERATRPDRIYRHEWAIGDLVIWDNTGVMHRACPYDAFSPREMHRTTMSGDEPIR
jgi:alpha-ketoglutarate-dependent taurine dioxygenase